MRVAVTYLTILLVGVTLGRNIDTDQANGMDAISQFSEVKTLENNPVQYRHNQMRQNLPYNEKGTNKDTNLKPMEPAVKGEDTIPSFDAIKKDIVKQPALVAQPIQKGDAEKVVKVPEIKEDKDVKESSELNPLKIGNDKIKAIEPMPAHDNKNKVNDAAEPKTVEIIKENKGIPAVAKAIEQRNAVEENNPVAKAVELNGDSVESETKAESKEKLSKDKKKTESKSSKTSEEKKVADKDSVKATGDKSHEKETKKKPKSSDQKDASKVAVADSDKTLLKISEKADQLTKSDDSHKIKDKKEDKKVKDDDDDDSDDDDSSDDDDD